MSSRPRALISKTIRVLFALFALFLVVGVDARSATSSSASSDLSATANAPRRGGEEISFILEHSVDGVNFKTAGSITGKLAVDRNDARNFRLSSPKVARDALDAADAEALTALARRGLSYRVRIPSNIVSAREGSYVMASLPARCVIAAGLVDALTLHTDDRGNAYGVEYATASGDCDPEAELERTVSAGNAFRTMVYVRVPKEAPGLNPDAPTDVRGHGAPASEKSKRDAEQRRKSRERGGSERDDESQAPKPEPTFLQRHWMKIMIASYVISFMFAPPNPREDVRARIERSKKQR